MALKKIKAIFQNFWTKNSIQSKEHQIYISYAQLLAKKNFNQLKHFLQQTDWNAVSAQMREKIFHDLTHLEPRKSDNGFEGEMSIIASAMNSIDYGHLVNRYLRRTAEMEAKHGGQQSLHASYFTYSSEHRYIMTLRERMMGIDTNHFVFPSHILFENNETITALLKTCLECKFHCYFLHLIQLEDLKSWANEPENLKKIMDTMLMVKNTNMLAPLFEQTSLNLQLFLDYSIELIDRESYGKNVIRQKIVQDFKCFFERKISYLHLKEKLTSSESKIKHHKI